MDETDNHTVETTPDTMEDAKSLVKSISGSCKKLLMRLAVGSFGSNKQVDLHDLMSIARGSQKYINILKDIEWISVDGVVCTSNATCSTGNSPDMITNLVSSINDMLMIMEPVLSGHFDLNAANEEKTILNESDSTWARIISKLLRHFGEVTPPAISTLTIAPASKETINKEVSVEIQQDIASISISNESTINEMEANVDINHHAPSLIHPLKSEESQSQDIKQTDTSLINKESLKSPPSIQNALDSQISSTTINQQDEDSSPSHQNKEKIVDSTVVSELIPYIQLMMQNQLNIFKSEVIQSIHPLLKQHSQPIKIIRPIMTRRYRQPHIRSKKNAIHLKSNLVEAESSTSVSQKSRTDDDMSNKYNNLNLEFQKYKYEAEKKIKELSNQMKRLQLKKDTSATSQSQENTSGRHTMALQKQEMSTMVKDLLPNVCNLRDIVEELRLDATRRGAKMDLDVIRRVWRQAEDLKCASEKVQTILKENVKPLWKANWESELEAVVADQGYLKEVERVLSEIQDDHSEVVEVLEALAVVATENENAEGKDVSKYFENVLSVEEVQDGYQDILTEIKMTASGGNSERRMKALERAERLRRWEICNLKKESEFELELKSVVRDDKLRKIGGVDWVEKRRMENEKEIWNLKYNLL